MKIRKTGRSSYQNRRHAGQARTQCGFVFNPDELKYLSALEITELHDVTIAQSGGLGIADKIVEVAEGKLGYRRFAMWLAPHLIQT